MWKVGIEVRQDMTAVVLQKKARSERDGRVAARLREETGFVMLKLGKESGECLEVQRRVVALLVWLECPFEICRRIPLCHFVHNRITIDLITGLQ